MNYAVARYGDDKDTGLPGRKRIAVYRSTITFMVDCPLASMKR